MRQPELRGQPGLVVIITALLGCLWQSSATAADYYKPPEFSVPPGTTIIHAGTLLAVPGEATTEQQSIIVQNGKVVEIRDGYARAADIDGDGEVRVIDLSDRFVMPGFIDLHDHSDFSLLVERKAINKVKQGVSTLVYPSCGSGAAPCWVSLPAPTN